MQQPHAQLLVSTNSFRANENKCCFTKVNFIPEDRMLRYTYLYENRMFTNKMRSSICLGGKGKDRVELIKSLIYMRAGTRHLRGLL